MNTFYLVNDKDGQGYLFGPCGESKPEITSITTLGRVADKIAIRDFKKAVKTLPKYKWTGPAMPDWTPLVEGKSVFFDGNGEETWAYESLEATPSYQAAIRIDSPSPSPASVEEEETEREIWQTIVQTAVSNYVDGKPAASTIMDMECYYRVIAKGATDNHPSPKWVRSTNPDNDELIYPKHNRNVVIRYNTNEYIVGPKSIIDELYQNGWEDIYFLDESSLQPQPSVEGLVKALDYALELLKQASAYSAEGSRWRCNYERFAIESTNILATYRKTKPQ